MAFVNCPVELLKVKLQTQYKPAAGALPLAGAVKPVRHFRLLFFFVAVQESPRRRAVILMTF